MGKVKSPLSEEPHTLKVIQVILLPAGTSRCHTAGAK